MMKIVNIEEENYLSLVNNLRNFNETFKISVTYDNIKNKNKKQWFAFSLENTFFFGKTNGGQIDPQAFLGLNDFF